MHFPEVTESERDTFYLTMLASIEVGHHKGNDVLVQAMNKVLSMYKNHEEIIVPQTVLMEVSFRGIHVIDKRRKNFFQCPTFDFFYSLQNISFCGAHPKQLKYFGFITKHPLLPRFACHVFLSSSSTQPIVESIGHSDEVLLDIGDAVHVDRTCEDHWCYGTNLRTGMTGIFPSAVVCEIDIVEEICMGALPSNASKVTESERDTFYLTMLASIEVGHHKGNDVLVQAMNKVLSMYKNHEEIIVPQTVLMEVSFRGIHVIDKRRKNFFQCPTFDFFYSLQNISFCGAHPKQLKYFGFITKHPLLPRFACHVFLSSSSTQPIVESIG
ncbi:phosphotyrosine interaction domain protein [Cooperia oncophora]